MIYLNDAAPDSSWLFYILICKMAKSIVLFLITKSCLKHVQLVCLTLSTTQSLN